MYRGQIWNVESSLSNYKQLEICPNTSDLSLLVEVHHWTALLERFHGPFFSHTTLSGAAIQPQHDSTKHCRSIIADFQVPSFVEDGVPRVSYTFSIFSES